MSWGKNGWRELEKRLLFINCDEMSLKCTLVRVSCIKGGELGKGGGAPPGIYIQRENLVNKLVSKANYGGRGASKIQTVAEVCGCPRPRPAGDISSWPCLDKLLDFDECREPTT